MRCKQQWSGILNKVRTCLLEAVSEKVGLGLGFNHFEPLMNAFEVVLHGVDGFGIP